MTLNDWCIENNRKDLLDEWDYEKNGELCSSDITFGSNKNIWWKCSKGHEWKTLVCSRTIDNCGCPYCGNKKILPGFNDLATTYPELCSEWDYEKNDTLKPIDVTFGSGKKVWWKCKYGHKWQTRIINRTSRQTGCPICTGKQTVIGINDLETWCKANGRIRILDEWDYSENSFTPREISYGSGREAYFQCSICGHKWKTQISTRTCQNADCPRCIRRVRSSFPEQCVFYYCSLFFPDTLNGDRKVLNRKELDIYIPSLKLAIEYNGSKFHTDIKKEQEKINLCLQKGITLYRICEIDDSVSQLDNAKTFFYRYGDWKALGNIIIQLLYIMHVSNPDVNIERDEYLIKEIYYKKALDNSLQSLYPEIAKEWHPTKNGGITPDLIAAETHDSFYWVCPKCGGTYKAIVKNRVRMKSGCKKCGQKVSSAAQMNKVINLDTGEIFENAREAAKKFGLKPDAIMCCCRGFTKTSGGYKWTYFEQGTRPNRIHSYKQKRVLNIDTGEIYSSVREAVEKTGFHNIGACCRGVRNFAGGYRWKYL